MQCLFLPMSLTPYPPVLCQILQYHNPGEFLSCLMKICSTGLMWWYWYQWQYVLMHYQSLCIQNNDFQVLKESYFKLTPFLFIKKTCFPINAFSVYGILLQAFFCSYWTIFPSILLLLSTQTQIHLLYTRCWNHSHLCLL